MAAVEMVTMATGAFIHIEATEAISMGEMNSPEDLP